MFDHYTVELALQQRLQSLTAKSAKKLLTVWCGIQMFYCTVDDGGYDLCLRVMGTGRGWSLKQKRGGLQVSTLGGAKGAYKQGTGSITLSSE